MPIAFFGCPRGHRVKPRLGAEARVAQQVIGYSPSTREPHLPSDIPAIMKHTGTRVLSSCLHGQFVRIETFSFLPQG